MHVNFAPLEDGPASAGGIAGYMRSLALEQRSLGHAVAALSSGSAYTPRSCGSEVEEPTWLALEPWEGVDRLQILNSPNLAPSLWQFGEACSEGQNLVLDRLITEILTHWKPDVLHVHSLEGLAASCIHAAVGAGVRVVMSLHNHHPFCPQVYLMRGRRLPCLDFQGGVACETCESPIDVDAERRRRAGVVVAPPPSIEPPPLPPVLEFEEDGRLTTASAELISQGHDYWQPLDNSPPSSGASQISSNCYGERRQQFVMALNACDRVLAVSNFVHELAVSMGVRRDLVQTQLIGTRSAERLTQPEADPDGVLRLVFLGFNNYYKGLPMLVDSVGQLKPELRGRLHLSAFGPGCPSVRPRAEAIRPRLAGLRLGGAYEPNRISELLAGCDIGVVPSVWLDNGPQTLMEFQSRGLPVLASRLGGIPDRVEHGKDGLLFRGNDRADAARQITRLLTEPDLIDRLWAGVRQGPTLADHTQEVVAVYEQTLELPNRQRAGH